MIGLTFVFILGFLFWLHVRVTKLEDARKEREASSQGSGQEEGK
jgi:hypothetical protein